MQLIAQAVGTDQVVRAGKSLVRKIVLTPAAAVSSLTVKDNTTVLLTIQAAANGNSVVVDLLNEPLRITSTQGLTVTVAGAGAVAYFGV